jgi:hypothetical protein
LWASLLNEVDDPCYGIWLEPSAGSKLFGQPGDSSTPIFVRGAHWSGPIPIGSTWLKIKNGKFDLARSWGR